MPAAIFASRSAVAGQTRTKSAARRQLDMADLDLVLELPQRGVDLAFGQRAEAHRGDEMLAALGQHRRDLVPGLLEQPHQLERLVGRDPAADDEEHLCHARVRPSGRERGFRHLVLDDRRRDDARREDRGEGVAVDERAMLDCSARWEARASRWSSSSLADDVARAVAGLAQVKQLLEPDQPAVRVRPAARSPAGVELAGFVEPDLIGLDAQRREAARGAVGEHRPRPVRGRAGCRRRGRPASAFLPSPSRSLPSGPRRC